MSIICHSKDVLVNTGVCALVNDKQVAIFRVRPHDAAGQPDSYFAIDNFDPFSQANVLARGLIGQVGDDFFIASPIYKQRFNLQTGACLDDATVNLQTYYVVEKDGGIYLG